MAAPNMTPTRHGEVNNAGAFDALYLKVFSGEVLTAYLTKSVMMGRHSVRTITSGKSAQHIVTGKGSASYHTPGTLLTGTTLPSNERVIIIDDLLVADRFVANFDEAMSQYDLRAPLARDIGFVLANTMDKNLLQVVALASLATTTVTGGNGGSSVTDADAATNGDSLVQSIFDAAQALDEKDVPEDDRYCIVKPAQYNVLVNAAKAINGDYSSNNGGIDSGRIFQIAGVTIVKSNNLPQTNVASGPAAYRGDFSNYLGLVFQKEAVGTTKLLDLSVEHEYLIQYQGTLLVGKYAVGHGILRPECAVGIISA
ncbi:MAG TPA: phage capsid protein [Anaerolineae bacterium]|nr:phage capsid protein [Anaerolineae bacterium]